MRRLLRTLGFIVMFMHLRMPSSAAEEVMELSLPQAIELALEHNAALRASQKNITLSDLRLREARWQVWPSIVSRSAYQQQRGLGNVTDDILFSRTDGHLISTGFAIDPRIFTLDYLRLSVEATRNEKEIQITEGVTTRQNVRASVENDFSNALRYQDILEVSKSALEMLKENYQTAEKLYKEELISQMELVRMEVNVNNFETRVYQNQRNFDNAVFKLIQTLGLKYPRKIKLKGDYPLVEISLDQEKLLQYARQNSAELRALDLRVHADKIHLDSERIFGTPNFTITGNYVYRSFKGLDNFKIFNFGVNFEIPFSDLINRKHRVLQAQAQLDLTADQKMERTEVILASLTNNVIQARETLEQVKKTQKNVGIAEKNLEFTILSYQNGAATALDISSANTLYVDAKTNYINVMYAYRVLMSELKRTLGVENEDMLDVK